MFKIILDKRGMVKIHYTEHMGSLGVVLQGVLICNTVPERVDLSPNLNNK